MLIRPSFAQSIPPMRNSTASPLTHTDGIEVQCTPLGLSRVWHSCNLHVAQQPGTAKIQQKVKGHILDTCIMPLIQTRRKNRSIHGRQQIINSLTVRTDYKLWKQGKSGWLHITNHSLRKHTKYIFPFPLVRGPWGVLWAGSTITCRLPDCQGPVDVFMEGMLMAAFYIAPDPSWEMPAICQKTDCKGNKVSDPYLRFSHKFCTVRADTYSHLMQTQRGRERGEWEEGRKANKQTGRFVIKWIFTF